MDINKQSVGIDISKKSFTACVVKRSTSGTYEFSKVLDFSNDKRGYNQLVKWVGKTMSKEMSISFEMEATGIYFEGLAYHLSAINKSISVLLPNTVSHYGKSLNVKTKTDIVDAKVIGMMSCDRNLSEWIPPSSLFKKLRSICRLHKTLQDDKTQVTNRLKQLMCGYHCQRQLEYTNPLLKESKRS